MCISRHELSIAEFQEQPASHCEQAMYAEVHINAYSGESLA